MSIWDYFNGSASPEQNAGLTGFAAALNGALGDGRRPVGFGQILSAGAQGMQQGRDQYGEQQQQQAIQALKLRAMQGDIEAQDRLQQEQMALQQAAQSAVGPDGQFNQEQFLRTLRSTNALKAIELEQKMAKAGPEFSTTPQTGLGPDGKPFQYLIAKNGEMKRLDGVLPRDELKLANLGGKDVAYNPFALQDGQTFQRTMTPGETASNQLGWANNAVSRGQLGLAGQRLAIDKQEAAARAAVGKAPTEFQGKSAAFGARAAEADKTITGLQGKYEPARVNAKMSAQDFPLVGGITGAVANNFLSDSEQLAEQAQRDFINAVLRQESGAAIGKDEFTNARRQYFPQPGDSDAVIQQKARNRALSVQGLNNNAGRAAFSAPAAASAGGGWSIKKVGQ